MFKKMFALLGLMTVMTLPGALSAEAKAPLYGEMDLQFNLAWPGPSETVPDWVGTVTFGDDEYGMAFFNTGTGKPFAEQPAGNVFFEETWVIYDELEFAFDPDNGELVQFDEGAVVLSGYDRGITTVVNSKYHMNGDVRVAEGDFAMWMGRSVHMMGDIVWYDEIPAPLYAPGTFRIN